MSGVLFDHMMLLLCVGSVMLARLDFRGAIRQFVIVAAALVIANGAIHIFPELLPDGAS